MPEYTVCAIAAALIAALTAWRCTKLFVQKQFWLSLLVIFAFQVVVDGWLTKRHNTIVIYDESKLSGFRVGLDTPIEDFLFGFALIVFTLVIWERAKVLFK